MNTAQAKQIPLEHILAQLGCKPSSQKGTDVWYRSPFREEKTASFKVNKRLNTWYDFGLGSGGTVIDFICEYYNESVKAALARLERSQFAGAISSHQTHFKNFSKPTLATNAAAQKVLKNTPKQGLARENKIGFVLDGVHSITNQDLIAYLEYRKISIPIAKQYLKQIAFHYGAQTWQQVALGFKNDAGCFELRNPKFKGFIKPTDFDNTQKSKTITSINLKDGNTLAIFEGFMDFLSYLTYRGISELKNSVIVLNSVSSYQDCQAVLQKYHFSKVYFFLDNDEAGKDTLKKLTHDKSGQPVRFEWVDESNMYAGFDDMNDFLVNQAH